MVKLTPLGERVILKPSPHQEKTKSGIYLPKSEDKKEGIVESLGTFKSGQSLPLKIGDKIIYAGYSSEDIEIEGEKFLIVEFKDVIAKVE
jgi:chaperonin GroES